MPSGHGPVSGVPSTKCCVGHGHRLIGAAGQRGVGGDHLGLLAEEHGQATDYGTCQASCERSRLGRRTTRRVEPCCDIRPFAAHDVQPVLALNNANVPELNELDAPEVARLAGTRRRRRWWPRSTGAFAGFCWVHRARVSRTAASTTAGSAATTPTSCTSTASRCTPTSAATASVAAFYAELVEQFTGAWPVLLCEVNVRPRNDASLHFHHSIGFREVGQQDTDGGAKTVSLLELARLVAG